MILRPDAYQPEWMQSDSEPYMSKYDVLRLESEADRVEAQRVASHILAHHGLSVEQLTEELEDPIVVFSNLVRVLAGLLLSCD